MEKVSEFGDTIKKRVLNNSIEFFNDTTELFGVNYTFSNTKFSNFNNDFYEFYVYKKQVFKYESDIRESLFTALAINLLKKKNDIELEDIKDGIYEYLTNESEKLNNKREEIKKSMEREYGKQFGTRHRRERY